MGLQYMLNEDTGNLHIVDFCCHTRTTRPTHIKYFDTEDDAYHYAGQKIMMCKICQKEKEKRLKGETK